MPTLSRADNSLLGRWWWTVDRWTLGAIGTLIGFGYIMMLAASPAGRRAHRPRRATCSSSSRCSSSPSPARSWSACRCCRRAASGALAIVGCIIALVLTAATLVIGVEIKGARRWIALPGHVGAAVANSSSRASPSSPPG